MRPRLEKMDGDIKAIKEAMEKISANQIQYINPLNTYWTNTQEAKMGGTMDVGAVFKACR